MLLAAEADGRSVRDYGCVSDSWLQIFAKSSRAELCLFVDFVLVPLNSLRVGSFLVHATENFSLVLF